MQKNPLKKTAARVTGKLRGTRPAKSNAPQKLHLLVTIVNRNKAELYMDFLQSFDVNLQLASLAEGTADTQMLHLLGLTDSQKVAIFSIIRDDKLRGALSFLQEKFESVRNGKGIAYTIPLSSVIGVAIYQFLSNNRMVKEG